MIVALLFELSHNELLQNTAKISKTLLIIVYIMNNGQTTTIANKDTGSICCFMLLWVLVIATLSFVTILIVDREKEHYTIPPLGNITIHNDTQSKPIAQ